MRDDPAHGDRARAHPYIPNSEPAARRRLLNATGLADAADLFRGIPGDLRLRDDLDLPAPLPAEADVERHVTSLLKRNTATDELLSFLGGGCYPHHVPAVCDEINARSEFLTAYAGTTHEDHGRFQALFEYQSLLAELLDMDIVTLPLYDGDQACASALRTSGRVTGRTTALISETLGRTTVSKARDYLQPAMHLRTLPADPGTGMADLDALHQELDGDVAAVLLASPASSGVIDTGIAAAAAAAHDTGALLTVRCDPISLGVLAPPASLGADITCGDIQSLGMHQNFGGGQAGFLAVHDRAEIVRELPARIFGVARTAAGGEYGFGDIAFDRTSFARRENGKEWVGTAAALWGITAAVYLSLMGPAGMTEVGETILHRTRYAMTRLAAVPGLVIRHERSRTSASSSPPSPAATLPGP